MTKQWKKGEDKQKDYKEDRYEDRQAKQEDGDTKKERIILSLGRR